ncbi:MAG: YcnI family protein [Myxococcota bacterium]
MPSLVRSRAALSALLSVFAVLAAPKAANAHISIISGPAFANTTQEVRFGIGHGCTGADTYSVRVEIPSSVSAVRPVSGPFGKASIEKDAQLNVVAVSWQKADIDVLDADVEYYTLTMRLKVPDQPFSVLYFPTTQVCRAADGTVTSVGWVSTSGSESSENDEPAPALTVLPARRPGWNKFAVPRAISSLDAFFSDALIVWRGKAAYSANPGTTDLIQSTSGVSVLSALSAGDQVWVKY